MDRVALAAYNNARWCDAACRAHGNQTRFTETLWICEGVPPRFYPSAVTLTPEAIVGTDIAAFKDSFGCVDGAELGFQKLFEASWIWHDGVAGEPRFDWRRIQTDDALLSWESGWANSDPGAASAPRQFPPSLMEDRDISFFSAYDKNEMIAGFALSLTDSVVGISNLFCLNQQIADIWLDAVRLISGLLPETPIVGYENGEFLECAIGAGFQTCGQLRVWVR